MTAETRATLAEGIGTFALTFIGPGTAALTAYHGMSGPAQLIAIASAFGGIIAIMILAIGSTSGCHINPAVTITMAVAGRMSWSKAMPYIGAQCVGAIAASGLLLALCKGLPNYDLAKHGLGADGNPNNMGLGYLLAWEAVMTAFLLFAICMTVRKDVPPGFAALAIGGTVTVAILMSGPTSTAGLNPARALGPALITGGEAMKVLWVFILGPILGGLAGWAAFRVITGEK